ncbi:MAG: dihydroorotase [Clostridia bacterium]|nr:dihydroorotase [Clostridia bacterium]
MREILDMFHMNTSSDRKEAFIRRFAPHFSHFDDVTIIPGFCDVHVHFREPGFSYKETMHTGTMAAARGGVTAAVTMPNLSPVPDSCASLAVQKEIINKDAVISVYPLGSITKGQSGEALSDMEEMDVIGFSDDGRGVQNESMMRSAMEKAKKCGKIIVAHCEDNSLLHGGYIHDGAYARAHGHRGICSESEYGPIARDIKLLKETGAKYHVCHVSTKESVEIIRNAKKDGVNITCETAPHYLILDDSYLQEDGRFKMNPPLRGKEDREALMEGILDGTVDMIATDHAPHSAEEKGKGLEKSAFGIVGIETSFQAMYTHFVKTGILSMEKLIELMCINPRARFAIPFGEEFSLWNLSEKETVTAENLVSMGKATPFLGETFDAVNYLTVCGGKVVYEK